MIDWSLMVQIFRQIAEMLLQLPMIARYFQIKVMKLDIRSLYALYSVINATLHLKLRNLTPLPYNMFQLRRAIIRCLVMLKLLHCIKYKIYKMFIYSHNV
jgi:hypothetical protein